MAQARVLQLRTKKISPPPEVLGIAVSSQLPRKSTESASRGLSKPNLSKAKNSYSSSACSGDQLRLWLIQALLAAPILGC